MKVIVSCAGGFHSPYLAAQLAKRDALGMFVTDYRRGHFLRRFPCYIDREHFKSSNLLAPTRVIQRLIGDRLDRGELVMRDLHDLIASAHIAERHDIFVGWSGQCIRSLRRANREGLVSIVVRGSAHICEQMDILREEHARFGVPIVDRPLTVERELREYEEAQYVQTISSFAKRTFVKRGIPESKIIVQSLGVDLTRFKQLPKEDDVFRVVYAGALSLRKGVRYLIEAFAALDRSDAELCLVGAVHEQLRPTIAAARGRVCVLGHQPEAELHRHYSQGSVFVLPSLEDGFAVVLAQAMACGLPIICTTNSGGEDLLGPERRGGFVVPIRDVEALREKLLYLYENREECRELGREAKQRVSSRFSWDDYGAGIVQWYETVIADAERGFGTRAGKARHDVQAALPVF
jgi:glycosyltransferase involved in cell wall biosynthesis